jgi:glucose-6-phosphate 1-dehydrogenase
VAILVSGRADAVVLFGASGDLAGRMLLPALYELAHAGRLGVPVVGVASSDWSDDDLRTHARDAVVKSAGGKVDEDALDDLTQSLRYVRGDYRQPATFDQLGEVLGDTAHPLLYLAIPPSMFETVVAGLARVGLNNGGRVVVEKPFGRDLASARELNACLLGAFREEAVFRIDHFLGKQAVLDLLVFRLANVFLDPVWNDRYVDSVQITMAEDFGVTGRGRLYDELGALRDVVQNHLLQVLTLVAMEPPVDTSPRALAEERTKVLRSMRTLDPAEVVRGQYRGYRGEDGVAAESQVETYVALRAWVDSWRWSGVPFLVRAGKRLATTATEVLVAFTRPPKLFFDRHGVSPPHPNQVVFRLDPSARMSLRVQINDTGEDIVSRPVELAYEYDERREGPAESAYARLLGDAMDGDHSLFAHADEVEEAWRVVAPILATPGSVHLYEPGSWGPAQADELLTGDGAWRRRR